MHSVKLGEIAKVISGYAFKSAAFKEGGSVPVLKIKNIKVGTASLEDAGYVNETFVDKIDSKFHVNSNDILISLTGSHMSQPNSVVGRVGRYPSGFPKALLNQRAGKVIPNLEIIDATYLFYVLLQDDIRREIAQMASGAASQANISPTQVESINIPLPNIEEQKKIGEVLFNYDNLIENNNRRIAILEDMAQSLYREWFVKLCFPGYQDCEFKESELGLIPEGWEVKSLSEVATVNPESITKKNTPDSIGYIDIKSVGTGIINEIRPMSFSDAPSRARRIVSDGDIIWATVRPNRQQYSYICRPKQNTIASTGFAVLRANEVPSSYLYFFAADDAFVSYLVNHATGSAYPAVNAVVFEKAKILSPSEDVLNEFDALAARTISQSEILKKKNKNLKKQSDLLLPKLISGSIDVRN